MKKLQGFVLTLGLVLSMTFPFSETNILPVLLNSFVSSPRTKPLLFLHLTLDILQNLLKSVDFLMLIIR